MTAPLTVIEQTARPSQLDAAVARMTGPEPTLSDIAAVLHLIGTADEVDGVRIQALCYMAARALGRFDADSRCAPPLALAEVVRDARQACENAEAGCVEYVTPWVFDGRFCSPTCRNEHMRSHGAGIGD
jgi:hypothetical protein